VDTIWPDKKRTRRQVTSQKQAEELDLRIRASRLDGTWRELRKRLNMEKAAGMTFAEAADLYLDQYVSVKNRDRRGKRSRLNLLKNGIGANVLLVEIDYSTAAKYASARIRAGASSATVNRDIAALRHMLTWAAKSLLIDRNPLDAWEKLQEKPYEHERPTDEIIDQVFAHLHPTELPLFQFLRHTGCRREEGLSLKRSQIDLKGRVAVLYKTKSGKSRTVPLTSEAMAAIEAMPPNPQTEYVFYHPVSLTRWHDAKAPWIRARKAAGVPWLRVHDLRHAYAIKLAEEGCPMHFISEVLGHASVDFTREQYAKFSPASATRAVLAVLEGGKKVATQKAGGE
jgi:integrase